MMIPNTPVSSPQLSHDVKKAMQRPVQYKDLNENSSYTYNTNPNKPSLSQQSAHRMCVTTNSSVPLPSPKQADKPQMCKRLAEVSNLKLVASKSTESVFCYSTVWFVDF